MSQYKIVDDPDLLPPKIQPISVRNLIRTYPKMREIVVDGFLREGETANLIAPAKMGKSFLAGNLAWSVATGKPWLSHEVKQGKVLIIDNELHPQTLSERLGRIAMEMGIDLEEYADWVDVVSLRGQSVDIHNLDHRLNEIKPGTYTLCVVDALYRTLPRGTSENDNAAMMGIYNQLDSYADQWGAAIVVIHHASKGAQGDKAVVDVGAGAGSIARAADSHIIIRHHEDPELAVLECVTRSFKSPEPVSIRFDYPLWYAVDAQPEVRRPKPSGDESQARKDQEADQAVQTALAGGKKLSVAELRKRTGMGHDRVARTLARLGAKSRRMKSRSSGKTTERFYMPQNDLPAGAVVWTDCPDNRPYKQTTD